MTGTSEDGKILIGHTIHLMEVFGYDKVLVRHDTLDGGDDELVANAGLQPFQMSLQVGRGSNEDKGVVLLCYLIDVAAEEDIVDVEVNTGEIGGIMAEALEFLDTVIAAHIPTNVVDVVYHNLGNRCCPAAAANNRYLTALKQLTIDN